MALKVIPEAFCPIDMVRFGAKNISVIFQKEPNLVKCNHELRSIELDFIIIIGVVATIVGTIYTYRMLQRTPKLPAPPYSRTSVEVYVVDMQEPPGLPGHTFGVNRTRFNR